MSHSNPVADRQLALLAKIDMLELHKKAIVAAKIAAKQEDAKLAPETTRGFDCGFAWVHAPELRATSRAGKELMALGFTKGYPRGLQLWYSHMHDVPTQSISVHQAAAAAYAEIMKDNPHGITFVTGSRYD